jgi:streptogramin lyase
MYNPNFRKFPRSSFVQPVPIPAGGFLNAPQVSFCFSQALVPVVAGALQQLTQPSAWVGTPAQQDAAVTEASALLGALANAFPCNPPGGTVWAMQPSSNDIAQFRLDGSQAGPDITSGQFNEPEGGLRVGTDIWVTQYGGSTIPIMMADGTWSGVTLTGNGLTNPGYPSFVNAGTEIWVPNRGNATISRFNPSGGVSNPVVTSTGGSLIVAALDTGSEVWVTNYASGVPTSGYILRFDYSGSFIGSFTLVSLGTPTGMVQVGANEIWIASFNNNQIGRFTTGGVQLGLITDPSFNNPSALAVVGSQIWCTQYGDSSIVVLSFSGSVIKVLSGPSLAGPNGVVLVTG